MSIQQLPYEVLLQIFHLLHPFNDLQSIALIPQLRPYLGELLCFINDFTQQSLSNAIGASYDNYLIEYADQEFDELKEVIKSVKGHAHRVIYTGDVFPSGFFDNDTFTNDSRLEGIYFPNVSKIGRQNWFEVFGDKFFECYGKLMFQKCTEMRIGLHCRDFPMMKIECPSLVMLDLKLMSPHIQLDFLKGFTNLKELRIQSDYYSIFGFRYLRLANLEKLCLISKSLELGFYGCQFPKLKKLDISQLKEMMIILDSQFDVLESLDLSKTGLIFPITLSIPQLERLNIKNHHPVMKKPFKLNLEKLESLKVLELSTFDILTSNPKLMGTLEEVYFNRDDSIDRKFEIQELKLLTAFKLPRLRKLVIQLHEPNDYSRVIDEIVLKYHKFSPNFEELVLIVDGVEDQFKLGLGHSASSIKISTIFSPQRKKRRSV